MLKKIMARLKATIVRPNRKLREALPELIGLRDKLILSLKLQPLDGIVYYFDITSKWQDQGGVNHLITLFEGVNAGQYKRQIEALQVLQKHIEETGRSPYGWNRTKPGETVTAENIFLGNVYGLFDHPVSFWKKKADEPKGGWGSATMDNLNAYDVMSNLAQRFISTHVYAMTEAIAILTCLA